jgi:hypothetical protein
MGRVSPGLAQRQKLRRSQRHCPVRRTLSEFADDNSLGHIHGSDEESIKLLEYGDYECPFRGQVQPIVKEIQRPLGDLCFAFQQLTAKGITHIQTLTVNKCNKR